MKKLLKSIYFGTRALSGPIRKQPDFLIIGGQKCGTTSLFYYLNQHPSIASSLRKEVHYFDFNYDKGINWYKGFFPIRSSGLIYEASPYYVYHPLCPQRIRDSFPDVKLVLVLRNPVHRCYSHYQHNVRRGIEQRSFSEALHYEDLHIEKEEKKMLEDSSYYSYDHQHFSYKARGLYLAQITRWLEFFSEDQLHILESGELKRNPSAIISNLFSFLGVDERDIETEKKHNVGSYDGMSPELESKLIDYYSVPNQALFDSLGQTFDW